MLTGGFPCQPFSVAGQRKGADDNRYLWPEMLRVIRETRPLWIIGENVAGITNMVQPGSETDVETKSDQDEENYKETILEQEYIINTICDDLEREGYSVQPIIVPACGVGAPHKRYRIWFIASDCSDARVEGLRQGREDKIHGFEFTSQTRDKIRRLITDAGIECTPEECKLIESLNRLAKKWEKDGKRLWLYSASGVLTVMMHGDREDNPIPEMLPNAGTNPDNIITTISGPIRRRRKTSGVSIWMWMILCINIITDNENKKDRMIIAYPSLIM